MAHATWFECVRCRTRQPEIAPGCPIYVCPVCSSTDINVLPPDFGIDSTRQPRLLAALAFVSSEGGPRPK